MSFIDRWVKFFEALSITPTEDLFDLNDANQRQIDELKARVNALETSLLSLLNDNAPKAK